MIVGHVILVFCLLRTTFAEEECEERCHFNGTEITKETIQMFPFNCSTVCGNLFFTSRTDASFAVMQYQFWYLFYLVGELHVENTNLTTLTFLPLLRSVVCGSRGLVISNNSYLENAELLSRMSTDVDCTFTVTDNPKLDITMFCEDREYSYGANLKAFNNLKSCGCRNVQINTEMLPYYENCTSVIGNRGSLRITGSFNGTSLEALSRLEKITGNLQVYDTDLTDLSFLSKLTVISGEGNNWADIVDIQNNRNLTRLRLSALKNLKTTDYGSFTISLNGSHPDFCLTTEEMQLFVDKKLYFKALEAKFCGNTTRSDGQNVCIFDTMSNLESDCVHLRGNVLVNSGDESHVVKLKTVKYIYGSLKIINTTLVNLTFFGELRSVASLKTYPSIQIISNKLLQNVSLPKLKMPTTMMDYPVMFQDNYPKLLKLRKECNAFEHSIESYVTVDGRDCTGYQADFEIIEETPDGEVSATTENAENRIPRMVQFSLLCILLWSLLF